MKQNGQFLLFTREDFGEWLLAAKIKRSVRLIQNHHTLGPDYHSFTGGNHFELLSGMKKYHLKRDMSDIAQNLTTFPDGLIAVCRPLQTIPAGIRGANKYGLCIEHLGNFDTGKDQMTEEQQRTILFLNTILCRKFNLTPNTDTIVYHHWYDLKTAKRTNGTGTVKTCPGTNFFGGNKVEDARQNFIPHIIELLAQSQQQVAVSK
jgi:hypothetical protein